MIDPEEFVAHCQQALRDRDSAGAIRELVTRAGSGPGPLPAPIGTAEVPPPPWLQVPPWRCSTPIGRPWQMWCSAERSTCTTRTAEDGPQTRPDDLGGDTTHLARNEASDLLDVAITFGYRPPAVDHGHLVPAPTGCDLR